MFDADHIANSQAPALGCLFARRNFHQYFVPSQERQRPWGGVVDWHFKGMPHDLFKNCTLRRFVLIEL